MMRPNLRGKKPSGSKNEANDTLMFYSCTAYHAMVYENLQAKL